MHRVGLRIFSFILAFDISSDVIIAGSEKSRTDEKW
jgi:hypothetical protein